MTQPVTQPVAQPVAKPIKKLAVGDILYNSWGYDQTNVDFYQVVRRTEKTVWVRPIHQTTTELGFMCGATEPIKDAFAGSEILKRPYLWRDEEFLSFSFGGCSRYEGTPVRCSWYA